MMKWLKRLRGTVGMGVTWAVIWAIVGGGIMEGVVDPDGRVLDMWPQTLAIPGFVCGVVFSMLLWSTEGRRRFDELSLPRFGALGAATGLLLGGAALAAGALPELPVWLRAAVILGPMTLLSGVSASASLAIAKVASKRELLGAGANAEPIELPEEARERIKVRR